MISGDIVRTYRLFNRRKEGLLSLNGRKHEYDIVAMANGTYLFPREGMNQNA